MATKTDILNTLNNLNTLNTLAAAIKRHKDQRTTEQHRTVLHDACTRLPEVKRAFALLTRALPADDSQTWPWLSVGAYTPTIDIGVSMRNLDSFKDVSLLRLLSQFAGDEWTPETSDHTYAAPNRDYRFKREIPNPLSALRLTAAERRSLAWLETRDQWFIPKVCTLTVGVYAYVKADSAACRIEVVGIEEEVIKREVKRIVCA